MPVFNERFEVKMVKDKPYIDVLLEFFKKNLKKNQKPLRYAIVGVRKNKLIVEASIVEE